MVKFFLIFILTYTTIDGCQNVNIYPHLIIQNAEKSHLSKYRNNFILQDGNQSFIIDPITLNKIPTNSESDIVINSMPINLLPYCNGKCDYQCVPTKESNVYLCGFTATLHGCPISKKKLSPNINIQGCLEQTPVVFLYENNGHKRKNVSIALQLECRSSKFETLKYPFDKLEFLAHNVTDHKFSVWASTLIATGHKLYGLCEYNISEIVSQLKNTSATIHVKDDENNWTIVSKKEFITLKHSEGFILNRAYTKTNLDWEFLNNESFTGYEISNFEGLDQQNYNIYYMSVSNGKIYKGINGNGVNITFELFCNIEGETSELMMSNHKNLLLLTSKYLYSLPLHTCNSSLSCTKCLTYRDPHCVWNKELGVCKKYDLDEFVLNGDTKLKKILSELKQDVKDGNAEKHCANDIDLQNTKILELLTKVDGIKEFVESKYENDIKNLKNDYKEKVHKIEKNYTEILESYKQKSDKERAQKEKELDESRAQVKILENMLNQKPNEPTIHSSFYFYGFIFLLIIIILCPIGYICIFKTNFCNNFHITNQCITNNNFFGTRHNTTASVAGTDYNELAMNPENVPSEKVSLASNHEEPLIDMDNVARMTPTVAFSN